MSVLFKSVKRKNPQDITAPEKYYAMAIANGTTDLKQLATMVATQSTVSAADCYAVLIALEANIITEMQQGKIVRLGEIGSFQLGISALGKDTIEEVTVSSIKKAKINFRPGEGLRNMLKTLTYTKIQDQAA